MKRRTLSSWMYVLPSMIVLGAFTLLPAIRSFVMSLQDVDPFSQHSLFVGFENYVSLFTSPEFLDSLKSTVLFILLTVVPSVLISLGIAVALDAQPFFSGLLRTVFVMPVAVSSAMAAMLWVFLYNPSAGYLNYVLSLIGISGPNWLADPSYALLAVAITTVWKEIGFNIIFFLAGLSNIPNELREAAHLDGARPSQTFFHVVLPLLSPTVLFVSIVSVIHSFESFGQIHILTEGGPARATTTLVYNLYRDAFQNFRSGYASAQAVILFLAVCLASYFQFKVAERRVHYGG